MKHILNNLSESEKMAIREQHEGGMKIDTSRFKKLLESSMGNVKPLISEEGNPPTTGTGPAPSNQTTSTGTKPTVSTNQQDPWVKVIAYSDPETTKAMTNIEIDPHMIGLEGNDVKFTYKVAGKSGTGTGTFNCNSENEMHFDGKPLTGTMYISAKRVDTLKSKCGANQGYASTGSNVNQNMSESRRIYKKLIKENEGRGGLSHAMRAVDNFLEEMGGTLGARTPEEIMSDLEHLERAIKIEKNNLEVASQRPNPRWGSDEN